MRMPGFTAEVSLYKTNVHYQALTATPTDSLGVEMARSSRKGFSAASTFNFPFPLIPPVTCYLDGLETDCDIVFGCLAAGFCELVYYQP